MRLNSTGEYLESKDAVRTLLARALKQAPTRYTVRIASISLKWGLISKLFMNAFSWYPLISGTLKVDSY